MPKKRRFPNRSSKASDQTGKRGGPDRRRVLLALAGVAAASAGALALTRLTATDPAGAGEVVVYKSPSCGCCGEWSQHLRDNGFDVSVKNIDNISPVKEQAGVPYDLESCHTAFVDGYAVEGHVPAKDIRRLLAERPPVKGLAVPGMPAGSPGMEGPDPEPYTVFTFDADGKAEVYARY